MEHVRRFNCEVFVQRNCCLATTRWSGERGRLDQTIPNFCGRPVARKDYAWVEQSEMEPQAVATCIDDIGAFDLVTQGAVFPGSA